MNYNNNRLSNKYIPISIIYFRYFINLQKILDKNKQKINWSNNCLNKVENHWIMLIGETKQRGIFESTEEINENWMYILCQKIRLFPDNIQKQPNSTEIYLNILYTQYMNKCMIQQINCFHKSYFARNSMKKLAT